MTRFLCVFLPHWPIERFLREKSKNSPEASRHEQPLALVASQAGGLRLTAVDAKAAALGLVPGILLADARARVPLLRSFHADPLKDRKALRKLARWCGRFTPYVAPWHGTPGLEEANAPPPHGLTLNITGCAHLFGGEENLARDILAALKKLGLEARLAIADTIGAAYALVLYGAKDLIIVAPGAQRQAIASLGMAALRLDEKTIAILRRLGLKRIKDLFDLPRASLSTRFGPALVGRLEQALGTAPEPLSPLLPHAPYRANVSLAEPISSQDHVLVLVKKLTGDVAPLLRRDGKGARTLLLTLFRIDGEIAEIAIRLAAATDDLDHVVQLFALKLGILGKDNDTGCGYEAARLDVLVSEPLAPHQNKIGSRDEIGAGECTNEHAGDTDLSFLIDRLGGRLGIENVLRLYPRQSHIPERAVVARAAAYHPQAHWEDDALPPSRPLLMLPSAEPAEVMALLPEGPPRQFRWRGVHYAVAAAEGPERIRPEWWRDPMQRARTRDYYIVEDEAGRRFWLYREGGYGGETPPRWFVHGVFA